MKNTHVFTLVIAVAFYCAPAFAQHGNGAGGGNAMGRVTHASANSNGASRSTDSTAAVHGKTMDQLLTQNKALSSKIASLTGEPAQQSCSGFKNLGQCVAAAHVSKNLGISFDCLKSDMTGTAAPAGSKCTAASSTTTGAKTMSLGKAIQTLSPATNSKTEAKKGQQQASQDLKTSSNNS